MAMKCAARFMTGWASWKKPWRTLISPCNPVRRGHIHSCFAMSCGESCRRTPAAVCDLGRTRNGRLPVSEPRACRALFSPRVRLACRRADPVARRAPARPRRGRRLSRARAGPGNPVSARRTKRTGTFIVSDEHPLCRGAKTAVELFLARVSDFRLIVVV
jgi:hypothetical protein